MVKNMTKTINARLKVVTPLGTYYSEGDEIPATKTDFQDYVMEITSLITDAGKNGVASFTNDEGDVVFIMPDTIQNSVVIVEKVG